MVAQHKNNTIILLLLFLTVPNFSQSFTGMNGLLMVPTAFTNDDGSVHINSFYIDKRFNPFSSYQKDAYTLTGSFIFLPFLEFSGKVLRIVGQSPSEGQGIGDRSISFRLQLYGGNELYPAVLIGLQNISTAYGGYRAIYDQSTYLVISKKIELGTEYELMANSGYGFDFIKASNHQFSGLFGGLSIERSFSENLKFQIMAEYDAKYINTGVRAKIFNRFMILVGLLDMKELSGGAGFSFTF